MGRRLVQIYRRGKHHGTLEALTRRFVDNLSARIPGRMLVVLRSSCRSMDREGTGQAQPQRHGLRKGGPQWLRATAPTSACQGGITGISTCPMSRVKHLLRSAATEALIMATRPPPRALSSGYAQLAATEPHQTFRPPGGRYKHAAEASSGSN
jgi:hypothetical protein